MPDISLLEPTVLREVVQKMTVPENLILSKRVPRTSNPFPVAQWEVMRGSRTMATPNVPNSEAHIVPRLGISQESATFIYLREKKVFQPTTLHWLKAPGTALNKTRAEESVLREVKDLNLRFDNFNEWALWQAVQGSLVIDSPDVQANVDYKFSASHKVTTSVPWKDASPSQIQQNITAWKQLILRDGQVAANEAFLTSGTLSLIVNSFTGAGVSLMSDRMKDEYYSTGTLKGFLGLDWTAVDAVYEMKDGAGVTQTVGYLPDGKVVFGNLSTNRPLEILQGPTADDDAPDGLTGRFAKSWKEKDPSARQYLIEENFLPVITRPEQIVVANVGALA